MDEEESTKEKEKWRNQRAFACVCMVRLLMLCGRGWLGKRIFRDLLPSATGKMYRIMWCVF